ncbi:hypothetical protein O3G_MSEX015327 [Manduca sexta]|uniref:Uncharacterized protein n=1 Tax=Manduca sexta TaxID=7130 RepID=A0A922D1Z2_MANSE|nr:hypothetical protein O3G_MSEX015327 [Manduca sexta]
MVYYLKIIITLFSIRTVLPMALLNASPYFLNSDSNSDIANYIASKNYVQNKNILPKVSLIKNDDTDVIYVLSQLSDEDLLRLLNEQPNKTEYDLIDIVQMADKPQLHKKNVDPNEVITGRNRVVNSNNFEKTYKKRFSKMPLNIISQNPVFRLENKEVDPYISNHNSESKYAAVQKIKNLLFSRPQKQNSEEDTVEEEKKEMLFEILVGQLKSLCCKRDTMKTNHEPKKIQIKSLLSELISKNIYDKVDSLQTKYSQLAAPSTNEFMFLVIDDEIKTNDSEELVSVDPESIENNSSVLILGPITSSLSDTQLKLIMNRISSEFVKPEYLPLLQQLSAGVFNKKKLIKSVISGPDTRRYIKPHRCNHQSKLAKVYGGPKWIVCTGYLNLNTPSLYDK